MDDLGSPFSQHALHMDSSLRSCPASMVSMTLGAEPLATPAPSKIDLKAASGFSLTDQYSRAHEFPVRHFVGYFVRDVQLLHELHQLFWVIHRSRRETSEAASTLGQLPQGRQVHTQDQPRLSIGAGGEAQGTKHTTAATSTAMRQTQRTRAATSTALWALARKEAATSTAPAQGAANSTAPGPHEPTDTQEWLPAQLLGHTPQTCPRTHTGAATSSAPGSRPPGTRAHAQKPHKPHLGTRHK